MTKDSECIDLLLKSPEHYQSFSVHQYCCKIYRYRPPSSETTSHVGPQFESTNSFSFTSDLTPETTLSCETKSHFLAATNACFTC